MALARQPSPSSQAWLGGQRGLVAIPSGQFGCDHHILESLIILLWALPFPLVLVLENSPRACLKNRDVTFMDTSLCVRVCLHPATK